MCFPWRIRPCDLFFYTVLTPLGFYLNLLLPDTPTEGKGPGNAVRLQCRKLSVSKAGEFHYLYFSIKTYAIACGGSILNVVQT